MVEPDRITPENFPPRPVGISLEAYEIMRHLVLSLHGQSPVDEAGDKLVDDYTLQILMGTAVEGQPSARFTGEDGWKDGYVVNKRLRLALLSFYDSPAFGTFRETHPYDREKLTFREAKGSRKTSTWESTSPEAIADAFLEIARKKSTKNRLSKDTEPAEEEPDEAQLRELEEDTAANTGLPQRRVNYSGRQPEGHNIIHDFSAEITRTPLLTVEEEIRLTRLIAQDKIAKQLMQQRIMIRTALRLLRATLDRQVSSSEIKRLQIAENTLTQQLQTANSKFDQTEGGMAFNQLLEANLRLVMSFVRNKTDYDVPLEDIIQEGNIGLMRAAEKFDPKKGFKFSTYARWWIRQAVNRVLLAERNIALPVYIVDNIDALHKVEASLCQELGRYPTTEEIGMVLNITGEQVKELRLYEKDTLSMEMPYGEDDTTLGDVIADQQEEPPLVLVDSQDKAVVNDTVNYALSKLTASEQEVIRWRYGIGVPGPLTLIKIGEKMGITRERVRQLEERALKKLQGEQPAGRTRTA